jgi:hypothetical protein
LGVNLRIEVSYVSLYDYYVEAAKQEVNNNADLIVNRQHMFNLLMSKIPAFSGLNTDKMRASTFAMESSRLNVDTNALSNAFDDLSDNVDSVISDMKTSIRNAYASTSVIITYYAAIKSFSTMSPYYTHLFVPTVKNIQESTNTEMIGTVLLNTPDILSTINGVSFSADCDLYTEDNSAYLYKYSYTPSESVQTANLTITFPQNSVSFVSFENFASNSRVIGVAVDGVQLDASQYHVYYVGTYVRVYFASSYEASSITLTLATFLSQHMPDTELYKLESAQKSIEDFDLDDMYRMAENIYSITGIKHLQNYLKSSGISVTPTLSSFAFFDISDVVVGYAEFQSNATLSYKFGEDIYGFRIFPEYPGIVVNGTYTSQTFSSPVNADTLDVTVTPISQYIPGAVGYIFALYR